MTYKIWMEKWLAHHINPSGKQRTYEQYCKIEEIHILPKLGDYELTELKPFILQKFVTDASTSEFQTRRKQKIRGGKFLYRKRYSKCSKK